MKKMTFLVAAMALSMSSVAFAGEKVQTEEQCCREGDDGCNEAYVASCDNNNVGHFCSTAKDASGNKLDYRVVWDFNCAAGENCTNTNGSISCLTEACSPRCEGNVGHFCDSSGVAKTITCDAGTKCDVSDTGYVSCVADDDELPSGECSANDQVGCTTNGNGYYCNSKTGEWGSKVCTGGKVCRAAGTSVDCLLPEAPFGECDAASAQASCSNDKSAGWYCGKGGTWVEKTCSDKNCVVSSTSNNSVSCGGGSTPTTDPEKPTGTCDPSTVMGQCNSTNTIGYYCGTDGSWRSKTCDQCKVSDRVNSVTCGEGGGGSETGSECSAGEMGCTSAGEGWYCSNGYKKAKTCDAGSTCGVKTYNGKKSVTCCAKNSDGQWYDAKYDQDVCESVYGQGGSDPVDPPAGCTEANHCSSDNLLAYNCVNGKMAPTACDSKKPCSMVNGKAMCVSKIDDDGNDKDDDGGCSAAGAGLMLGWLGLALVPAIRRRNGKK